MKDKISSDLKYWLERAKITLPKIGSGFTNPWHDEEMQKILHDKIDGHLDSITFLEGALLTWLWSAIGDNMKPSPNLEKRLRQVMIDYTYVLWDIKKAIYTGEQD